MYPTTRLTFHLVLAAVWAGCGLTPTEPGADLVAAKGGNGNAGGGTDTKAPIVFSLKQPGAPSDLYLIQSDGSGLAQLTGTPGAQEFDPQWSPDRTRIAYLRYLLGDPNPNQVCVIDLATPLVPPTCEGLGSGASGLAWSSDGSHLWLAAGGILLIWVPGNQVVSVLDISYGYVPASTVDVSRDGKLALGYNTLIRVGPEQHGLFVPASFTQVFSAPAPWIGVWHLQWSPDGTRLAFHLAGPSTGEVFLMGQDGSGLQQLTTAAAGQSNANPTWSPDGRSLVYTRFTGSTTGDLMRISDKGKGLKQITATVSGVVSQSGDWW